MSETKLSEYQLEYLRENFYVTKVLEKTAGGPDPAGGWEGCGVPAAEHRQLFDEGYLVATKLPEVYSGSVSRSDDGGKIGVDDLPFLLTHTYALTEKGIKASGCTISFVFHMVGKND